MGLSFSRSSSRLISEYDNYYLYFVQVPLILPILEMLFALFLVIAPLVGDPRIEYLWAALFIVGGFVFYIPFIHFKLEPPFMGRYRLGSYIRNILMN